MSLVATRDYTDVKQMLADYAALRAKLYAPAVAVAEPVEPPKPKRQAKKRAVRKLPDPLAPYRQAYEEAIPQDLEPQVARQIIAMTAQEMGVYVYDITGPSRVDAVSRARAVAIWRVAEKTGLSLSHMGRMFSKDHTTVIHAIRRMNDETGQNIRNMGGVRGIKSCRPSAKILDWQKAKDAARDRGRAE